MRHYAGDLCEQGQTDRWLRFKHLCWTWEFRAMLAMLAVTVAAIPVAMYFGTFP